MGWLHKRKPVEAIIDPASGELSSSRMLSWVLVFIDFVWVAACIAKLPAKEAYAPVSGFLAGCTIASFTAYGVNSYAGARGRFSVNYESGEAGPVPRAKPAPPEGS